MPSKLLLLDRDGTLNRTLGRRPPNSPAELSLLPNVRETLQCYVAAQWQLVLISNQAGVAFGHITEHQLQAINRRLEELLGLGLAALYVCLQHPNATIPQYQGDSHCRKPKPGMILQALADFKAQASDCLMVGDMETDRAAAEAAGVPFCWAADFFSWRERQQRAE